MTARRATMVGLVAVMAAAGAPAQAANIFEELGRAIFGGGVGHVGRVIGDGKARGSTPHGAFSLVVPLPLQTHTVFET